MHRSERRRDRPRDRRSRQRQRLRVIARPGRRLRRRSTARCSAGASRRALALAQAARAARRRPRVSHRPRRRRRPARLRVRRARHDRRRLRVRRGPARARQAARRGGRRLREARRRGRQAARTRRRRATSRKTSSASRRPSSSIVDRARRAVRTRSIRSAVSTSACSPTCASSAAACIASSRGKRVLNLFSYTGALSAHVRARRRRERDERRHVARRATRGPRATSTRSGFAGDPRWKFETGDAVRFLARAARDKERYDVVLIDPPTFSTARGAPWTLDRDYPALIAQAPRSIPTGGVLWLAANTHELGSLAKLALKGLAHAGRTGVDRRARWPAARVPDASPRSRTIATCRFACYGFRRAMCGRYTITRQDGPRRGSRGRRSIRTSRRTCGGSRASTSRRRRTRRSSRCATACARSR